MKWNAEEFYPTPKNLLDEITKGIDWKKIRYVLEPSAGKGDIAEYCKERYRSCTYRGNLDIDCIEIDHELRQTLKGKELKVIHDDFLAFRTFKHYDLIIMNPPFSKGASHLLHALDLQRDGFGIICILNAETIRNPYTNERKALVSRLEKIGATIEYMEGQFLCAERPTGVEIAVVKAYIPEKDNESKIFTELREKFYQDAPDQSLEKLAPNDYIEAAVRQFNIEVEAGIRLIQEYKAMRPYILCDMGADSKHGNLTIELKVYEEDLSINGYVRLVRRKYWNALFNNPKFTGNMTSNLIHSYMEKVSELSAYDFSVYNISTLQIDMSQNLIKGIEDCIVEIFDKLSYQCSYSDEFGDNIHYYNGWKTNKSWYINNKVILPGINAFSRHFNGQFDPAYAIRTKLADIEKALNYLDGGLTVGIDLNSALDNAVRTGQTRKIRLKYFYVTFYKKGTCHIEFTDEDLLKKLNIFGSQQKGWLPQGYGKRRYRDMDPEEQQVIDSFEGEESYAKTVERANYFIYDPMTSVKMLEQTKHTA